VQAVENPHMAFFIDKFPHDGRIFIRMEAT
jgi:hypothetical protein